MNSIIDRALAARSGSTRSQLWRRSLLLVNLSAPLFLWATGGAQLWAWLYAFVAHHALLGGLFLPNSNWLGPILRKLPTDEKLVWLTIDDGPSNDTTALAEMLREMDVSATFFLQGKRLTSHDQPLPDFRKLGHTVANHTQSHDLAWFWIYPPAQVAREVDDFHETASRLDLPLIPAFRCPAGIKNPFLHGALGRRHLTLAGWSIRAHDGIRCESGPTIKRMISELTPGAILLVHEGKPDSAGAPASVAFIRDLVLAIRAAGYRFAATGTD